MAVEERDHPSSSALAPGGNNRGENLLHGFGAEPSGSTIDPVAAALVEANLKLSAMRNVRTVTSHQGAFPEEPQAPVVKPQ